MFIKRVLPAVVKKPLRALRAESRRYAFARRIHASHGTKRAFFLLSVDERFPNLGDQAMAVANALWLKRYFGQNVVEVAFNPGFDYLTVMQEQISEDDWIFLHSGGNLGDTWPEIHPIRLDIVSRFARNRVVQLPQTIHFTDSPAGQALVARTQEVFRAHQHLTIIARDPISFRIAQERFSGAKILSSPDTALLLDPEFQRRRKRDVHREKVPKVLVIMRNDCEGILGESDKQKVLQAVDRYAVTEWDTEPMIERFTRTGRLDVVMKWLQFIDEHDAVVTDRFHGMIFSVITRKPCVLLPTGNHKIGGALEWFKDLPFVRLASGIPAIGDEVGAVLSANDREVPDWDDRYFGPLMRQIGL